MGVAGCALAEEWRDVVGDVARERGITDDEIEVDEENNWHHCL